MNGGFALAKTEGFLLNFLHKLGKDHNLLPIYFAFYILGIFMVQGYAPYCGTPFGDHARSLYGQIFDQYHAVTCFYNYTVTVPMDDLIFGRGPFPCSLGPFQYFIFQIQHIQQILGPTFLSDPAEHTPGHYLYGNMLAPHTIV